MEEIELCELKKIMINILLNFHNFCIENGLRYSLWYGSAIGAVRHNGFIPWDDDLDVAMPRKDYEKFKKIYKNSKNYKLLKDGSPYNCYIFSKLYDRRTYQKNNSTERFGVYIDIFPLDNKILDDNTLEKANKIGNRLIIKTLIFKDRYKKLNGNIFKTLILSLTPSIIWTNAIKSIIKNGTETPFYLNTLESNKVLLTTDFFEKIHLHQFENYSFFLCDSFDTNLKKLYGNYMVPPPSNECIPIHHYHFYYK